MRLFLRGAARRLHAAAGKVSLRPHALQLRKGNPDCGGVFARAGTGLSLRNQKIGERKVRVFRNPFSVFHMSGHDKPIQHKGHAGSGVRGQARLFLRLPQRDGEAVFLSVVMSARPDEAPHDVVPDEQGGICRLVDHEGGARDVRRARAFT